MEKVFIVIPIIIGVFLIGFIYVAYFFVLPPFYHLHSVKYSRSGSFSLGPEEQKEIWILPAPKYTQYPHVCLTEDLTFDLNFSIVSNYPINLLVCPGGEGLCKTGTNISEVLSQTVPLDFPRYPGDWLSRTKPPQDGIVLYMTITNLGQEENTTSLSYSVIGYYRLGASLNFIIVITGILIIGITVLITLLHSITVIARKLEMWVGTLMMCGVKSYSFSSGFFSSSSTRLSKLSSATV